ncbi:IS605 OrfB family transposase [Micromonospora kangleipakensis]|uniref:IS605 OrfB family transposase n=1 Tax=Micromonospora kangleipakensis TaxID=1077942 RepID=A0A4Q8BHK0_9ACTN|nr:RNA-guided endonuclease TnpB family protein [Micromonospora kangleipakensis]RZU76739.1 IS605 OrfB family transposase [Micromonospora kangleipakensis]
MRWYHGTFTLDGRWVRIPTAKGTSPLWVRLARDVPYPVEQVRSVTLLCEGGRLFLDVTAEVPVAVYPPGEQPDPARVGGVDLGIIHPYAVAGPDGEGLLVSGRAIRAEHRMHLADTKARRRAVARRAPKRGEKGSRRWRQYRRRARLVEGRHRRRVRQAQHEAARSVVSWAVGQRVGVLHVGDPRGVLDLPVGRRHNLRLRQWQIGRLLQVLTDKATLAGISVRLVDERGTSSTCPACRMRVSKPRGRTLSCPHCAFSGHRDLVAAASIATRTPAADPPPWQRLCCRRWSRTVEPAGICPVPAGPDVTPAALQGRREDQLARGGPPHQPVGSRSPNRRGSTTPTGNPVNVSGHRTSVVRQKFAYKSVPVIRGSPRRFWSR